MHLHIVDTTKNSVTQLEPFWYKLDEKYMYQGVIFATKEINNHNKIILNLVIMRKILILFCVLMTGIGAFAQSAVTASGGEASGNPGNLSYSIGQTFCSTNEGTSGQINEGVQQPYEIFDVTEVQSAISEVISLSAFPNPTTDYLTLRIESDDIEGFDCAMYDISGKEILQKRIISSETSLDMNSLPSATYFVRVTKQNREIKAFKIVKN